MPDHERSVLEAEGVRSIAVAPIMVEGEWWGVLGFDDCDRRRGWNHEMAALLTAAGVLGAAVERHTRAGRIAQQDQELREARKLEAVGRLAGGVAHDINNLLSVVLGNVALALEHGVDDEAAALLIPVMAEVGRSRRLIGQLLTFARRQDVQQEILELGSVVVESEVGQGATFHVLFPAATPPTAPERPADSIERVTVMPARSRARSILLVEDHAAVRAVVVRILERAGHTVRASENPDVAMGTWESDDWVPDIVITDMVMPGTDVLTFVRRVRERWPGVEIVGMSGHHDPIGTRADLADPREEVDRFLPKPFEPEDLLAAVDGRDGPDSETVAGE